MKPRRVAIIGAADLGQLLAYHVSKNEGFQFVGFFDDFRAQDVTVGLGKVVGKVSKVRSSYEYKMFDEILIGVGYKHFAFRKELYLDLKSTIPFSTYVHHSSYVDPSCVLRPGSVVLPGCTLDRNVKLGNNVLLNTGCVIAHDTSINDHSFLGPGVNLAGYVAIGECCFIGVGTTVINNVTIGDSVLVGGGSVVVKNLKLPGLYYGIPATIRRGDTHFDHDNI